MKARPKQIEQPEIESAHVMTAGELNGMKFSDRHTILTPEVLKAHRKSDE